MFIKNAMTDYKVSPVRRSSFLVGCNPCHTVHSVRLCAPRLNAPVIGGEKRLPLFPVDGRLLARLPGFHFCTRSERNETLMARFSFLKCMVSLMDLRGLHAAPSFAAFLVFLHGRSGGTLPTGMGDSFATEAFTLLGVGIAVIALRVVARATAVGFRRFQFDDYLMCFAAVCLPVSLPLNLANSTTDYLCTGDCYSIRCWRLVPRTCKQWHD